MIASLRRRHRIWTLALAVTVPPAFAAALVLRPAPPTLALLPESLVASPAAGAAQWERDDLFAPLSIEARWLAAAPGSAQPVLELAPRVDPMRPDLLVYWASAGEADRLPAGAALVGRLAGTERRRFALPPGAAGGRAYLYSLGHAQLVASAALPEAR